MKSHFALRISNFCRYLASGDKMKRYTSKLVRYILRIKCDTFRLRYDINPYYLVPIGTYRTEGISHRQIYRKSVRIYIAVASPQSAQLSSCRKTFYKCNLNIVFCDFACKNHTVAFNTAKCSRSKVCNNNNALAYKVLRLIPLCYT